MGTIVPQKRYANWLPFEEARAYVHSLGLKNQSEWHAFCASGKKPKNIPSSAPRTYHSDWISWPDWLGTDYIATRYREFLPFEQAREYARSLHFQSGTEWRAFCKAGKKPDNIPANPARTYPDEWKGWGDWLGTGNFSSADMRKGFLPFEEARKYAGELSLKGREEWVAFCKAGKKPESIPANPPQTYPSEWKGWGDWLGTGNMTGRLKHLEFLPFEQAREYARNLSFKGREEWFAFCKAGNRPNDIPSSPNKTYSSEWMGWGDWFGTDRIANMCLEFLPFEEAREYARSLRLTGRDAWRRFCETGKRPEDIPSNPNATYCSQWEGWGDWLGTGNLPSSDPRFIPKTSEEFRRMQRKHRHIRRSRKKSVSGSYTTTQIQEQLKRQKYRCYYAACGFAKFKRRKGEYIYHVEHTFPLSRVAGTDIPANDISYIVLACPSCNDKKGSKFPWEWGAGGRLL